MVAGTGYVKRGEHDFVKHRFEKGSHVALCGSGPYAAVFEPPNGDPNGILPFQPPTSVQVCQECDTLAAQS